MSFVGKERGEGLSDTVRDHSLDGSGVFGLESGRTGVSRGFLLGLLAEDALVVNEGLQFSLYDIVGVDILDPRTVECIISPNPKRVNKGNESSVGSLSSSLSASRAARRR